MPRVFALCGAEQRRAVARWSMRAAARVLIYLFFSRCCLLLFTPTRDVLLERHGAARQRFVHAAAASSMLMLPLRYRRHYVE